MTAGALYQAEEAQPFGLAVNYLAAIRTWLRDNKSTLQLSRCPLNLPGVMPRCLRHWRMKWEGSDNPILSPTPPMLRRSKRASVGILCAVAIRH